MILHSPTERGPITRYLARFAPEADIEVMSSPLPERRGVDFLWKAQGRWWGVQRKELRDLLASFDDGRLTKEIAQMLGDRGVTMPHLMVEGQIHVDLNGNIATSGWGRPVTIGSLRGRMLSVAMRGVYVSWTRDQQDTAKSIIDTYLWSQRADHSTSQTRPKPQGAWGKPTNRDYQLHLLQGLPDVGAKTAAAILDHFGRCPLVLDVTEKELLAVPGIGKVTARRIMQSIEAGEVDGGAAGEA